MNGLCGGGTWGTPGLPPGGGRPRGRGAPRGGGLDSGGAGEPTPGGGSGMLPAVGPGGIGMSSVPPPLCAPPLITVDALFLAPVWAGGPPPGGTVILLKSISGLLSVVGAAGVSLAVFTFALLFVFPILVRW